MKTKQTLKTTTAWLIFLACALAPVHCTKEDPAGSGEPPQNAKTEDENAVSEAKENLVIGYSGAENADGVTKEITLPREGTGNDGGSNGVTIGWASDNDDVINVETRGIGVVTQPAPGESDVKVTLTAIIKKNTSIRTKTFTLVVLARTSTVNGPGDCPAAPSGYTSPDEVSDTDTRLACSYEKSSGNASLDDECPAQEGLTYRGSSASGSLLTCNWTKNSTSDTDAVTAAKTALAIGYTSGDGPTSVTGDVTLPTTGADGVSISWASSHGNLIDPRTGMVTRPDDMDTEVTLDATLFKGGASDTKVFTLTVIISASGADTAAVTAAKTALAVTYTSGDTASSVTGNLTLPTTGADGVSILWASSHPGIISTAGVVTRPNEMGTDVTLTATLTKNAASDTKTFTLTVIISASGADTVAVTNAKNALAVTYSGSDTASSVTGNLTLPTSGADGVVISWASSETSIISAGGVVIRPDDMNTDVVLTATLSKGTAADQTKTFTLTVIISVSGADTAAVTAAKTALAVTYTSGDTASSVTGNLTLPTTGADGVSISWASSHGNLIDPRTGMVTRPDDMDTEVTLTATLTKNTASDTKTFTLTVIISVSGADTNAVTAAKNALMVGYTGGDGPTSVTGNVSLPTTGADGVSISWASSETSIIGTNGVVTRPDDMNTDVVLTATLSKGAAADQTKTFTLTVIISASGADTAAVTAAKNALAVTYTLPDTAASSVTRNVTLPTTGADGVSILWMSSNTGVIGTNGVVTRPNDMNTDVVLTATLSKGTATDQTKTFTLTVIISASGADTAAVTAAKTALAVTYTSGDTASSVTGNLTLPTSGADGVSISWASSHTSIISTAGAVTRPDDMNTDVTLTATLTKNAASDTKQFPLTVIISVLGADTAAVTAAKTALAVTYTSGDGPTSVTGNVTLPTTGADGVSISWASSHTGIIGTTGAVTRPDDMTTDVVLTATLSKGAAADQTKTFTLTVLISDAGTVKLAKDNLVITYAGTDDASDVTQDVTLATSGTGGVSISWMSTHTSIISTGGTVSQPEDTDTVVTLTATLSKGSATDTKNFMLTVKRTYPFQCTGGMASMERSATAGVTKCILCDPTHTLVGEACVNYPYECAQGMASTDRSLTEGVTKCAMCNAGYALVNEDCVNYPYQCMNGMAVSERSLTEGVTKCESCDTHYVLEGEECVAGYRYTCENGMRHDGITQIQGEVKCKFCDSGYILDPSDMSCRPAGEGTKASPYLILTYEGLKGMRNNLTAHYRLGANIDASPSWSEGANGCAAYEGDGELPASSPCTGWVPVGDDPDPFDSNTTTQFTGSLDGGGYTISNLYVYMKRTSGHAYGGLFGYTGTGAEIKNVGLTDVYVHVSNTGTTTNGGGLVAWNIGTITNSYATGSVTFSSSGETNAGGLVGFNRARIVNSYAASSVTFSSQPSPSFNGGLVGNNFGAISNSYATGSVTFSSSSSHSGGLVGYNSGGSITNSYATGSVGCGGTCPNPIFGGLVGENRSGGTITGTNYFVDDQGGADGVGLGTCAMGAVCQRRTFVELGALTSVTGWEASDWDFDTATQLPRLKYTEVAAYCTNSSYTTKATCEANSGLWLAEGAECEAILLNTAANDGDANIPDCGDVIPGQVSPVGSPLKPHIITTYAELKTMRNDLSAHYKLGGNIDASASWEEGAENCDAYTGNGELPTGTPCTGWVPVGDNSDDTDATRFTGSLDGAGYTINDLYVYVKVTSGTAYGGLFGYAGGRAEIRNLGLTDVYVNVSSSSSANSFGGGLAGWSDGTITSSYTTGEVTADSSSDFSSSDFFQDSAGGLVGISYGAIMNSYATGDVTTNSSAANKNAYGGGLVGQSYGTIMNSYATGDVEANSSRDTVSGGLSGRNAGTIMNSYATGDVEVSSSSGSSSYGGGLVGLDRGGTITNSYATGDVEATSTSGTSYGGGLVGYNDAGTISNSYARSDVTVSDSSASDGGGLAGWNNGTIVNSYATGQVSSASNNVAISYGGLVGYNRGTISNSYATGNVNVSTSGTSNCQSGGLVGQNDGAVSNSYARGDVTISSVTTTNSSAGGLVGVSTGTIMNSYATTGNITVSSAHNSISGGLVGSIRGTITGTNYFVHNGAGADDDDGVGNGTCANTVCQQRTLAQLAALTSVTGWAASDWHFSVTTHLPRLKYAELAAYCTDSSKTTKAACEAANPANNNNPFGAWLAEGAECEAITPPRIQHLRQRRQPQHPRLRGRAPLAGAGDIRKRQRHPSRPLHAHDL